MLNGLGLSRCLALAAAILCLSAISGSAKAMVLTFDDVPTHGSGSTPIVAYGGLLWGNTFVINGDNVGLDEAVVSGQNVAYNGSLFGYGLPTITGDVHPFDFNGAYFTSIGQPSMTLTLSGWNGLQLAGTYTTTLTSQGPT